MKRSLFEDQKLVLKDCTSRFEKLGIPYMLSGSMAMIAYAMMRMTNDIDIVLELRYQDADRIMAEFDSDYYIPHGRVHDAIQRKRMFNMLHQEMIVKVDCVIRKDTDFQKNAFSRRRRTMFAGIDLWVITKEDLILSKMDWAKDTGSEMQIRDVANIIRNGYDEPYVEDWARKLGLLDLLQQCRVYLEQNYVDGHDA